MTSKRSPNERNKSCSLDQFIDQGCSRILANHRLQRFARGALITLLFWLAWLVLSRFVRIPHTNFTLILLLVVGFITSGLYTFLYQPGRSRLLYVLDQYGSFDGALLTWHQHRTSSKVRNNPVYQLLTQRLRSSVKRVSPPPQRFPSRKASAFVGLFVIGFGAQLVFQAKQTTTAPSPETVQQSTSSPRNNQLVKSRSKKEQGGTDSSARSSMKKEVQRTLEQARELNRSMEEERSLSEEKQKALKNRRQELRDKIDTLQKQLSESDKNQQQSSKQASSSSSGAGHAKREHRSPNTSEKNSDPVKKTKLPTDQAENKKTRSLQESGKTTRSTNRELLEEKLRTAMQLTRDRSQNGSDNEIASTATSDGTGNREVQGSDGSPEDRIDDLNWDQFRQHWNSEKDQSVQTKGGVRNWSARYDRSLQNYRSYLRSHFSSD